MCELHNYEELCDRFILSCKDDYTGLWEIVKEFRELNPNVSDAKPTVFEALENLLESRTIEAGYPSPDGRGFVSYTHSSHEILNKVQREWDQLGRDPSIGEIMWFNSLH